MDNLPVVIGEQIKKRRKRMGLNPRELERKMGKPGYGTQVNSWERGKYMPDAWNLCDLADALECSVDEILGRA